MSASLSRCRPSSILGSQAGRACASSTVRAWRASGRGMRSPSGGQPRSLTSRQRHQPRSSDTSARRNRPRTLYSPFSSRILRYAPLELARNQGSGRDISCICSHAVPTRASSFSSANAPLIELLPNQGPIQDLTPTRARPSANSTTQCVPARAAQVDCRAGRPLPFSGPPKVDRPGPRLSHLVGGADRALKSWSFAAAAMPDGKNDHRRPLHLVEDRVAHAP